MNSKQYLLVCLAAILLLGSSLGVTGAQAKTRTIPVPGAVPIQFDKPVRIDAQSNAFKSNSSDLHVVSIGQGKFHLASNGSLTATLSAGVLQWVNADYGISVAVFDAKGHLLGKATHEEPVKYIRLGRAPLTFQPIPLDFGVSDSFHNARYVVVAISERKSLPSD